MKGYRALEPAGSARGGYIEH